MRPFEGLLLDSCIERCVDACADTCADTCADACAGAWQAMREWRKIAARRSKRRCLVTACLAKLGHRTLALGFVGWQDAAALRVEQRTRLSFSLARIKHRRGTDGWTDRQTDRQTDSLLGNSPHALRSPRTTQESFSSPAVARKTLSCVLYQSQDAGSGIRLVA
jgi:hypothetical protein